jgi:DNA-directed RNA polymerase subunit N
MVEEAPEQEGRRVTDNMIPVRCISCGKVVSAYFDEFKQRVDERENPKEVLDDLGLDKYCCRRMLISHVEVW